MDDNEISEKPDLMLAYLKKQDLYTLSVADLDERISALRDEIARCEAAKKDRGASRSEADKLFNL